MTNRAHECDDSLVDEYDKAWRRGPGIENWVDFRKIAPEVMQLLVEVDLYYRKKLGDEPRVEEFVQRFPDKKTVVNAAFEQIAEDELGEAKKFGEYYVVAGEEFRYSNWSVVWPVQYLGKGEKLAAKVTTWSSPSASMKREIETIRHLTAKLTHVVQLLDHGRHQGQDYFIMPWYEADNLDTWCGTKPLATVLQMMIPLIREIATVHSQGVLHRDIKPKNLLYDEKLLRVLLIDFGLSSRVGEEFAGTVSGTPHYIAPELYNGTPASIQSDVYAMGATLYRLFSGQHPFGDVSGKELEQRVLHEFPIPLRRIQPKVNRNLSAVIDKCIHPKLEQRYSNMNELADDLQNVLENKPVSARELSKWERTKTWIKLNRPILQRVGAITVLLLAGIIIWDSWAFEAERARAHEKFVQLASEFENEKVEWENKTVEWESSVALAKENNQQLEIALALEKDAYGVSRQTLVTQINQHIDASTKLRDLANSVAVTGEEFTDIFELGLQLLDVLAQPQDTRNKLEVEDSKVQERLQVLKARLETTKDEFERTLQAMSKVSASTALQNESLKQKLKMLNGESP